MEKDNCIFRFLISLNIEFDEVEGRIIGRKPLSSIREVFFEVHLKESRHFIILNKKDAGIIVENFALTVNTNVAQTNSKKSNEKSCIWCNYYNKLCHMHESYWKIHDKPLNWKGSYEDRFNHSLTTHEAGSVSFNKEHMNHILKLLKSNSLSGTSNAFLALTSNEKIITLILVMKKFT